MRRRSKAGGEPLKTRGRKTAARKPAVRRSSATDQETEFARIIHERDQALEQLSEALEQQTATSEVLRVISSSPGELGPRSPGHSPTELAAGHYLYCGSAKGPNVLDYVMVRIQGFDLDQIRDCREDPILN